MHFQQPSFNINPLLGAIVWIKLINGENITGEFFCHDSSHSNTFVLSKDYLSLKSVYITSEEEISKECVTFHIVKISSVADIRVLSTPTSNPEISLNNISRSQLEEREAKAISKFNDNGHMIGVHVSKEAQDLFNYLYPGCSWLDRDKIQVMGVTISPPYYPENCEGKSRALETIQQLLERYFKKKKIKKKNDLYSNLPLQEYGPPGDSVTSNLTAVQGINYKEINGLFEEVNEGNGNDNASNNLAQAPNHALEYIPSLQDTIYWGNNPVQMSNYSDHNKLMALHPVYNENVYHENDENVIDTQRIGSNISNNATSIPVPNSYDGKSQPSIMSIDNSSNIHNSISCDGNSQLIHSKNVVNGFSSHDNCNHGYTMRHEKNDINNSCHSSVKSISCSQGDESTVTNTTQLSSQPSQLYLFKGSPGSIKKNSNSYSSGHRPNKQISSGGGGYQNTTQYCGHQASPRVISSHSITSDSKQSLNTHKSTQRHKMNTSYTSFSDIKRNENHLNWNPKNSQSSMNNSSSTHSNSIDLKNSQVLRVNSYDNQSTKYLNLKHENQNHNTCVSSSYGTNSDTKTRHNVSNLQESHQSNSSSHNAGNHKGNRNQKSRGSGRRD